MGQHWSHLTPTKRIQLDAFIRAGMKPTDIAKELGVHHTTIYRELKRCTYEHLNSDYTTETRLLCVSVPRTFSGARASPRL